MSATLLEKAPVNWGELPDIDAVEPMGEGDAACLAELRDVLLRHGKEGRFGIALSHKHFDVAEDEILVEYSDPVNRVLTIRPVKKEDAGPTVETIWLFARREGQALLGCAQYCGKDVHGNHSSFHRQT